MKKGISINISILSYILFGILTSILFTAWLIKQDKTLSITQFITLSSVTCILGVFFPRLMSPIRCLIDYIIWKLHGYTQSIFLFLFFIKTEHGFASTSNLYLIDDLIQSENTYSLPKNRNRNRTFYDVYLFYNRFFII